MGLSVVVPCFNEGDNVAGLVRAFIPVRDRLAQGRSLEVVSVDDGSRDDTWSALHAAFRARGQRFAILFERDAL